MEKYIQKECKNHGFTQWVFENSRGRYRCVNCRVGVIHNRRQEVKRILVETAGGKCQRCGYDKSMRALSFHHRERTDKEHTIAVLVRNRKLDLALEEIKKCDLLCANCHMEVEGD